MQNRSLHYPDELVTYKQIMEWKDSQEELTEAQLRKAGDYLTLKKQVEGKWMGKDKKRFIQVKNLLKTHSNVISDLERIKVTV